MTFTPTGKKITPSNFVPTGSVAGTKSQDLPIEKGGGTMGQRFLHYLNPFSSDGLGNAMLNVGGDIANPFAKASIGPLLEQSGVDVSNVPYLGNIAPPKNMTEGLKSAFDVAIWAVPGSWITKPFKSLGKISGLPNWIYQSTFKQSKKEIETTIAKKAVPFTTELLNRGVYGSDKSLLKTANYNMEIAENSLQQSLKESNGVILKKEIEEALKPFAETFSLKVGEKKAYENSMLQVLKDVPQRLDLPTANKIKRELYTIVSDKAFLRDAKMTAKKDVQKQLARILKQTIEKKSGTEQVRALNQTLSIFGKLRDKTLENLAIKQSKKFGMMDTMYGGAGFIAGGPTGALGMMGVKKAAESTAVKTTSAVALDKAFKLISKGLQASKILPKAIEKMPGGELGTNVSNLMRLALTSQMQD